MANRQITSDQGWTILSWIFLVAMLALFVYLDLVRAKAPEVAPQPQQYSTAVISELTKADSTNVFLKTTRLRRPAADADAAVQYQESELGKNNLGQLGQ